MDSVVSQKQGVGFITQPKLIETFQALSGGQHGGIVTSTINKSAHSRAQIAITEVPLSQFRDLAENAHGRSGTLAV